MSFPKTNERSCERSLLTCSPGVEAPADSVRAAALSALDDSSPLVRFFAIHAVQRLGLVRVAWQRLSQLAETDESVAPGWGTVASRARRALEAAEPNG